MRFRHGDTSPDDAVVSNVELAVRVNRFSIAFETSRSAKASSTDAVLDFADCLETLASGLWRHPFCFRLGSSSMPRPPVTTLLPTALELATQSHRR